ncbi:MAG TPA: glycosyltransferase family 39 protein [Acidimicrobiales bacterium]|nr:glycosyltransferase family 39 protein [Acidimicrobiales bacterium]
MWRLVYVQLELPFKFLSDEEWYVGEARQLLDGHAWRWVLPPGRPTALHGPLTSILFVPFVWAFQSATSLREVMAVLGTGTVVLLGLAARELGGDRVGLLAAAIAAAFPDLWIRDGLVVSEPVATLFVVLAVWVSLLAVHRRLRPWHSLALGACAGLVALARAEIVLAVLVLGVAVVLGRARPRAALVWRHLFLVALAAVVVVGPWVLYNQGRFKGTVLLTNNLGSTLAGADCNRTFDDLSIMGFVSPTCTIKAVHAASATTSDEAERSSIMRRRAVSFVEHHLDRVPLVVVMREAWFLGLYRPGWVVHVGTLDGQPAWATWLQALTFYVVFAAAMVGWWRHRRAPWPHWLLGVLVVNSLLTAAVIDGVWRYRVTLDVGVVLLLALVVEAEWTRRHAAAPPSATPDRELAAAP